MGPGVIGRTSTVSAIATVMLGGAIITSLVVGQLLFAGLLLLIFALAFFYYMHAAFDYAKNHKGASVTEGAEYVAYVQATQGAKSDGTIKGSVNPIPNIDAEKVIHGDIDAEDARYIEDRDA